MLIEAEYCMVELGIGIHLTEIESIHVVAQYSVVNAFSQEIQKMVDQLLSSFASWGQVYKAFTRLYPLVNTLALSVLLNLGEMPLTQAVFISQNPNNSSLKTDNVQPHFLEEGIYLFGQSPQPEQIGQAYLVFEVKQGRVTGAFYMPNSSFDCFTGVPQGNQLNLSIIEAYSQEAYSYQIGFSNSTVVAAAGGQGTDKNNLILEGFHRLSTVSENDTRILNQCKVDLQ